MITRRTLLTTGAVAAGAAVILPYAAMAEQHMADSYETAEGSVTIHPISHASFVMETPLGIIYNDPVGDPALYADYPEPALILITHEHGDHYNVETLNAVVGPNTQLITNPAVFEMLPDGLKARATSMANGDTTNVLGLEIEAIPAYNTTEERKQYHPEGRDNGYLLGFDGLRVYIAGDTEDTPEMRAMTDIDVAFVPMNLPYTMTIEQAAAGVEAFAPKFVYPYHYRDSDAEAFAELVRQSDAATEVKMGPWYN